LPRRWATPPSFLFCPLDLDRTARIRRQYWIGTGL
jgi:hypothetical protein